MGSRADAVSELTVAGAGGSACNAAQRTYRSVLENPVHSAVIPLGISPAEQWLLQAIDYLKALPYQDIRGWPEACPVPVDGIPAPPECSLLHITLSKRTRSGGSIQVRLRCERLLSRGYRETVSAGFTMSMDGAVQDLGERDLWELQPGTRRRARH
jgi:hypothetical protein